VDDARGVGEALNETLCGCAGCLCKAGGLTARGRHLVTAGPAPGASAHLRQAAQQLNDPVLLAFADLPQPPVAPSAAQPAENYAAGAATTPLGAVTAPATSAGTAAATSSVSGSVVEHGAASPLRGKRRGCSSWLCRDQSQVEAEPHPAGRAGLQSAASASQGIIAALGLQGRWSGLSGSCWPASQRPPVDNDAGR